jgi:hypothetical protein
MVSQNRTAQGRMSARQSLSFGRPTAGRLSAHPGGEAVFGVVSTGGRASVLNHNGADVWRDEPLPVECDEQDRCEGTGLRSGEFSFGSFGARDPGALLPPGFHLSGGT